MGIPPLAALAAGVLLFTATSVFAGSDTKYSGPEIRLGAMAHDIEDGGDEDGVDISVEYIFRRVGRHHDNRFLNGFLRPRPNIGATISTNGDTSQFYAGFLWDVYLTDRLFLETGVGAAVHDGALDEPGRMNFGCRVNFHDVGSVGFHVNEKWTLLATVEHMSNANFCDPNRGLTNVGLRIGRKLN